MEDCARGVAGMGLGDHTGMSMSMTQTTLPPWNAEMEEGYMADGEQHMPQYAGEYGIVYNSIEPRTPVQRSPKADGAAPYWSVETSSFADGGGLVGSFSPLQDDGLGYTQTPTTSNAPSTPPTSGTPSSSSNSSCSSIKKSITERAEARARYEASRDRNRLGRLMDKMSELCIAPSHTHTHTHTQPHNQEEPEHIHYLRHRLLQAQRLHETLGAVDEDFEKRYGFDLLEVEGGLEMCLDAGFGLPGEEDNYCGLKFRWVG